MIRKIAGNQPDISELCSSLPNCEQHLILFSFSTLQGSLWQSYQALIQQALFFLFFTWKSVRGSGSRFLMRLSFIAQETMTLPFDNYSFVFCLVNHMKQALLADKMLSQVNLHLNSENAEKMSEWVTRLWFKLLHEKKVGSKRFLNPDGLINTPITSCFPKNKWQIHCLSNPNLLFLLSTSKNGESVPPIRQTNEKSVKLRGSDIYISSCFVHLGRTMSKWGMSVSRLVLWQKWRWSLSWMVSKCVVIMTLTKRNVSIYAYYFIFLFRSINSL